MSPPPYNSRRALGKCARSLAAATTQEVPSSSRWWKAPLAQGKGSAARVRAPSATAGRRPIRSPWVTRTTGRPPRASRPARGPSTRANGVRSPAASQTDVDLRCEAIAAARVNLELGRRFAVGYLGPGMQRPVWSAESAEGDDEIPF